MATITEKLNAMVNKPFLYKNEAYLIKSHSFNERTSVITIETDKDKISFILTTAAEELLKFTPLHVPAPQEKQSNNNDISILNNGAASELKNILMDNIKKVQSDKNYIEQASEINNNVKTIIDIAKTEISMMVAINKF